MYAYKFKLLHTDVIKFKTVKESTAEIMFSFVKS